jgi:2-dehydro-3-deoxyphosphogalactonate aldolase
MIVVSPNTNTDVIAATAAAGMVSCPGFFTPSEGFAALGAGAHALKLFPAEAATPAYLKAQRAVLPKEVPILVVGSVKPDALGPWIEAGANGFGLGSGVFKPGKTPEQVLESARAYVTALGG